MSGSPTAFDAALAAAVGSGGRDREVDTAASLLAAAGAGWDALAAAAAARVVRESSARGWTLPDLLRMTGRELTARHQRLAEAVLADPDGPRTGSAAPGERAEPPAQAHSAKTARTAGSARSAQSGQSARTAEAGEAGEPPAPTTLGAFAAAERLDRFSAATAYVEVLCLCARLPRIPVLPTGGAAAAPNGAPGPGSGPASGAASGPASKMLGRIRALLAKAESTGFPEEAEALSAKAQQLMAAHSIDEALLAAHGAAAGPGARRIGVERPYEGAKALLLDAVAAANRCEAVWAQEFGFSTVVGHTGDLDAVELLYTSLLVQADRALHQGVSRSRDYRESFLIAYAAGIRERLTAAAAAEVATRPAEALLPALAARDLAVRETRERLFPSTSSTRLKGRDADGWQAGRSTARAARL